MILLFHDWVIVHHVIVSHFYDEYIFCFEFLPILNCGAAMNMTVQVFLWQMSHPLDSCPRVIQLDLEVDQSPVSWRIVTLIHLMNAYVCPSTSNEWVFQLLHILTSMSYHPMVLSVYDSTVFNLSTQSWEVVSSVCLLFLSESAIQSSKPVRTTHCDPISKTKTNKYNKNPLYSSRYWRIWLHLNKYG